MGGAVEDFGVEIFQGMEAGAFSRGGLDPLYDYPQWQYIATEAQKCTCLHDGMRVLKGCTKGATDLKL